MENNVYFFIISLGLLILIVLALALNINMEKTIELYLFNSLLVCSLTYTVVRKIAAGRESIRAKLSYLYFVSFLLDVLSIGILMVFGVIFIV